MFVPVAVPVQVVVVLRMGFLGWLLGEELHWKKIRPSQDHQAPMTRALRLFFPPSCVCVLLPSRVQCSGRGPYNLGVGRTYTGAGLSKGRVKGGSVLCAFLATAAVT